MVHQLMTVADDNLLFEQSVKRTIWLWYIKPDRCSPVGRRSFLPR